jgi:ABC-type multidrug transport system ATPase subunit
MLQVQGLSVEVGGRLIVDGTSFTVMPRDKVGLVGRNGAGKTSLFKVLGGAAEATGGKVVRKGGFGYLPQDPRIAGVLDTRMAVTHVLSGRQIDEQLDRIEKLRVAMEADPNERNVARYSRRRTSSLRPAGTRPRARRAASWPASAWARPDGAAHRCAVSGGERRRVELSRILFAGSDVLLLDEPTNHLDIDAKDWLLSSCATTAARCWSSATTSTCSTKRSPACCTSTGRARRTSATWSSTRAPTASTRPRRRRRGAPRQAGRRCREGDRPPAGGRRSLRRQGHEGQDGAQQGEADRPPRGAAGARGCRRPHAADEVPRPAGVRATVIRPLGMSKGYGGPPVFEDVNFDLGRGERLLVLGLNGAGKTSLLRILAGETTANLGDFEFGHQVTMGYYAQEHDNLRTDRACSTTCAPVPPGRHLHRDPAARVPRHDGPQRREGVPGERHALGRREDQAGAGDADGRPQQPAAARRAHQQPRPAQPSGRGRCAHRVEGQHRLRQPRHRVRRGAVSPPRCC